MAGAARGRHACQLRRGVASAGRLAAEQPLPPPQMAPQYGVYAAKIFRAWHQFFAFCYSQNGGSPSNHMYPSDCQEWPRIGIKTNIFLEPFIEKQILNMSNLLSYFRLLYCEKIMNIKKRNTVLCCTNQNFRLQPAFILSSNLIRPNVP